MTNRTDATRTAICRVLERQAVNSAIDGYDGTEIYALVVRVEYQNGNPRHVTYTIEAGHRERLATDRQIG